MSIKHVSVHALCLNASFYRTDQAVLCPNAFLVEMSFALAVLKINE